MSHTAGYDARKHLRLPSSEVILFSVPVLDVHGLRNINTSGLALNVSAGGACIKTFFALEPGQVLSIVGTRGMKAAMVQWVKQNDSYCVAGIKNV